MTVNSDNNSNFVVNNFRSHGDRIDITHEGKTLKNIKKYSDEQGRFLFKMGQKFKLFDVAIRLQDTDGNVVYVNKRSLGDKYKHLQEGTSSVNTVAQRISKAIRSFLPSLTYSNAAKDRAAKEFLAYRKPPEPAEVKTLESSSVQTSAEPTDFFGDEALVKAKLQSDAKIAALRGSSQIEEGILNEEALIENDRLVEEWLDKYRHLTNEAVRNEIKESSFPETSLFVYKRGEIEKFITDYENNILKGVGKNGKSLNVKQLEKVSQTVNTLIEEIKIAYRNQNITLENANNLIKKLAQFSINFLGQRVEGHPPLIQPPKTTAETISRENHLIRTWEEKYQLALGSLNALIESPQTSAISRLALQNINKIKEFVNVSPGIFAGMNEDGKILSKEHLELVNTKCKELAERLNALRNNPIISESLIDHLQHQLASKVRLALTNSPLPLNVPVNKEMKAADIPYRIDGREEEGKSNIHVFLENFPERFFKIKGQNLQEIILPQLSKAPSEVAEVIVNLKHLILVSPMQGYECLLRYTYSLPIIPQELMVFLESQNIDDLIKILSRLENVKFQGKEIDFPLRLIRAYIDKNQNDEDKVDIGYRMMAKLINGRRAGVQLFTQAELEKIGSKYASEVSLNLIHDNSSVVNQNDLGFKPLFDIIKKTNPEVAYRILLDQDLGKISWEQLIDLAEGVIDLKAEISEQQKALALKYINTGGKLKGLPFELIHSLKDKITHLNLKDYFEENETHEEIFQFLSEFPSIENLRISSFQLQSLPSVYKNLKTLDCSGCSALVRIPNNMSHLTSLNIGGCNKLVSINGNYPELIELELGRTNEMSLSNISGLFPKLESLNCNNCHQLRNISGFFPSLKILIWNTNLNMENISGIFPKHKIELYSDEWRPPVDVGAYQQVNRGLFGDFRIIEGIVQPESADFKGKIRALCAQGDLIMGTLQAYIPFSSNEQTENVSKELVEKITSWLNIVRDQMLKVEEFEGNQTEKNDLQYKLLELKSNIEKCLFSKDVQKEILTEILEILKPLPSLPNRKIIADQQMPAYRSVQDIQFRAILREMPGAAQLQFIQSKHFPSGSSFNPQTSREEGFNTSKIEAHVLQNIESIDNDQLRAALKYIPMIRNARNNFVDNNCILVARAFGQKPPLAKIQWSPLTQVEINSLSNDQRFLDALPMTPKEIAESSLSLLNKIKETNPSKAYALLLSSLEHVDVSELDIAPLLTFAREAVDQDDLSGPKLFAHLVGLTPPGNLVKNIVLTSKERAALVANSELLKCLPLGVNTDQYIALLNEMRQDKPRAAYTLLLKSLAYVSEGDKINLEPIIKSDNTARSITDHYVGVLAQMKKELSPSDFNNIVIKYLNQGYPLRYLVQFFKGQWPPFVLGNVKKLNVEGVLFNDKNKFEIVLKMFPKIKNKEKQVTGEPIYKTPSTATEIKAPQSSLDRF